MKARLYAPSWFEVPRKFSSKTHVFGMGKEKAQDLVDFLESHSDEMAEIIFGCAGSLNSCSRRGEVYAIENLFSSGHFEFVLPAECQIDLPRAKLASSDHVLRTASEKQSFFRETGADLVDMEMGYLWEKASTRLRKRLVFLRGVLDEVNDELTFLRPEASAWKGLLRPQNWRLAFSYCLKWKHYLRSMESALEKLERIFEFTSSKALPKIQ